MKILLFGKSGQVGRELLRSLASQGQLIAPGRLDRQPGGDLADLDGIARAIASVRPQVIVNAAAYTAVDRAESEGALCHTINALAPQVMAEQARRAGAWMVHFSSDYVFDGSGSRAWSEEDTPAPINVYGKSKAEGDRRVAAACPRHLILRTSWVYAAHGGNFLKTMLRLAQERDRLSVVDDQWGAPTPAELIADVTAQVLRAALAREGLAGLYNVAAKGETNWYGYARFALDLASAAGWPVKASLQAVPTSAYPAIAPRPHNSRLNTQKLEKTFGLQLPPWQQGVERALAGISRPAAATPAASEAGFPQD
ncbi:MAG: dTDP-4-dehydrorhamnose reductase [Ramlibacter sp.]|nr:dTDP-4-dehydrorhamnose reductase [Ramlibacter sp.]